MAVEVITDNEFQDSIKNNNRAIVIYSASWCGNCKLFAPKFKRLSNDERFEGVTFLNIDAESNEKARKVAGVDNLPYFATFENGELKEGTSTSKEDVVVKLLDQLN